MKLPCACGRELPDDVIAQGAASGLNCTVDKVFYPPEVVANWSPRAGLAEKAAGMAQAEAGADRSWLKDADSAIQRLADTRRTFTADDVWPLLKTETRDGRALGPVFLRAAKAGWIRKFGFVLSGRTERHKAPIQVWESLVFKGRTGS